VSAAPVAAAPRLELVLQQVQQSARELVKRGKVEEALEVFGTALGALIRKNRDLELLVAKLRRERIAKVSERVDPDQLRLMFELLCSQGGPLPVPDVQAEEREDAQLREQIEAAKKSRPQSKRRRKGAPLAIERQVHYRELPDAERGCEQCGRTKGSIGEHVTHRLEYVPGHFVDHETHMVDYACGTCREGVVSAPAPPQVIVRSPAGASLLAHLVVSKFVDHTPLHRLDDIYARAGMAIPVSTLSDWMGAVADLLQPLVAVLVGRLRTAVVIRTDATGIKVLDHSSPDNIERGTMWCYVGDDRSVVFRYAPTGAGSGGPWEFLKDRTGYVQADAASVFDRLFNGLVAKATEVGCWAHGRRRFVALRDTDCRVAYPLLLIGRLYRIERLATVRNTSPGERVALRQELSVPVLDKLKRWLVPTAMEEPPGSDLAKAVAYVLNQWEPLNRFVEDGRLDIDNTLCERQQRAIAMGRRNYLFCGSHQAAHRAAVLYSLTRTAALHGLDPLLYFTDVLRKLAAHWRQSRIAELLPGLWKPGEA
jgi:transposase